MSPFTVFVIRLTIGTVAAIFLTRFFYPNAGLPAIIGLLVFVVGIAYVLEAFGRRKKEKKGNS
jgi:uncharacterized membrane protein HdeD (DUF308 family)